MILLYHAIVGEEASRDRCCVGQALPRGSFERQMSWLARNAEVLPLDEYLRLEEDKRGGLKRKVAVTFDDGMVGTYENAVPVLRKHGLPAVFFVSTSHLDGGAPLWFSYLNALCFEGVYLSVTWEGTELPLQGLAERKRARWVLGEAAERDGRPDFFCRELAERYPLPEKIAREYSGMNSEQIRQMSQEGLFEIGAHTMNHVCLGRVSVATQSEEICGGKRILGKLTKNPLRYFAYPGGDYDERTLEIVEQAGFEAAVATIPRGVGRAGRFEVGRMGIYSGSMIKFFIKMSGAGGLLRPMGLPIG